MSAELRRGVGLFLLSGALSGSLIAFAAPEGNAGRESRSRTRPPALSTASKRKADPLRGLDPLSYREQDGRLVADLEGGRVAELSLDPALQRHLLGELERFDVPYGAVVALQPKSGRVLAYVSHSSANPNAGDLARDASAPAASVFKLVTASALVDAGVGPGTRACYGGGFSRLTMRDLIDDPLHDRSCATLSEALGSSINTVFAKLADRNLSRSTLERYAQAFGFGHALPFDVRTQPSPGEVPAKRLEFARTAAGFWHMHMSPLHASLIAATIANDGVMPLASMVDSVRAGEGGEVLYRHESQAFRPVIPKGTARAVGDMMTRTVSHGTARKSFHDARGRPFLPGITVAGKTGSLSAERPYRAYSWWVGYAPHEQPTIAVAALVVNTPKWRIKASYLAREALREYLVR